MDQRSRALTVWLIATVTAALVVGWLLRAAAHSGAAGDFADLLVTGCAVVGAVGLGWLWVLVSLVVVDAVGGRPERAAVPAVVRRLVLAACGLTLAGGLSSPAHAAPADREAPRPGPAATTTALLVGLPLPDRTTTTTQWVSSVADHAPAATSEAPQERPDHGSVVVRPGDTLWDLALDSLPADASTAEVDRRWREIYRANRDAVGVDPDLIRPGQRLLLPSEGDHR
jgi:hypothetical protein